MASKEYGAKNIKVLEGLEAVRNCFDIFEIEKSIKRKGDVFELSQKLKVKPRSLNLAISEARILRHFPDIHKSKANALSRLRTDRELIKFSNIYNVEKLQVRELYKLVKKWNYDIQHSPLMLVTAEENNLIIGSLLGDASIRQREKNSCFRFSHSIAQRDYAEWKKKIMSNFELSEFREVKRRIKNGFIHAVDFSTKTHPIFNYYRNLIYKSGIKKVTPELLIQLNPASLAVWICDDGSYSKKQGYIILCTNSFSMEEHNLMKEFFNRRFGLNPTVGFRDGKYYYLRFKQEDSKKLINIVKPFIPFCMLYKIGGANGS